MDPAIAELLAAAKALPGADDMAPGRLGQLIASVEYAVSGKPIRKGSPWTIEARVDTLRAAVDRAGT